MLNKKKYPHHEKEALALVTAVTKFHKYLFGKKFILYSDNKPIVSLLSQDKSVPTLAKMRLQRWAVILSAYNYELRYRKGSDLILADYLSRKPLPEQDSMEILINHVEQCREINIPIDVKLIALESQKDPVLNEVYKITMLGWPDYCQKEH